MGIIRTSLFHRPEAGVPIADIGDYYLFSFFPCILIHMLHAHRMSVNVLPERWALQLMCLSAPASFAPDLGAACLCVHSSVPSLVSSLSKKGVHKQACFSVFLFFVF